MARSRKQIEEPGNRSQHKRKEKLRGVRPNQIKQNITLGLRKKGFKGFWVNYRSGDDNSLAKTY